MAGQIGLIRQIGVIGLIGGLGGLGAWELRSIFRLCGMPATCACRADIIIKIAANFLPFALFAISLHHKKLRHGA